MSPPRDHAGARADAADAEDAGALPSLDELAQSGDTDGLLDLAKSYRASRDLKACFQCYETAAQLGAAEAEHALGLFCLSGGVVPQDEKRAASLFRSAADKGYLPSRVYLANMYELGVFYKKDPDKADVWYRSAARTAKITADPASTEFTRAMAELGCVRHCLARMAAADTPEEERVYYARKAKAYGWRAASESASASASASGSASASESESGSAAAGEPETLGDAIAASEREPRGKKREGEKKARGPSVAGAGLVAFAWAALLVGAAVGAGLLGLEGVRLLVAKYGPVLGAHEERVVLGAAAGLALFGTLLVYTFRSALKALLVAALFAGLGWFTWSAPALHLFKVHPAQAIAFGVAGYLAALLALGVGGGAKPPRRARR